MKNSVPTQAIRRISRALGRLFPWRPRIAIGAIFKNEAPYVVEWLAFHRVVGIDRFFVADNGSDDGTTQLLAALDAAGLVDHIPFPGVPGENPQMLAYNEILRRHSRDADWIAFIDADEFLVPTDDAVSIRPPFEKAPDNVGAIVVNWAIYGSSGNETAGDGMVIERFVRRAEEAFDNNHVYKSVVRAAACLGPANPHRFRLRPGFRQCHVDGRDTRDHPVRAGGSLEICWEGIRLNHYVVKSKEEFTQIKARRGPPSARPRQLGPVYFHHHDRDEVRDPVPGWLTEKVKEEVAKVESKLRGIVWKGNTQ